MLDVVTFGETMILLTAEDTGPMRFTRSFRMQLGGAESNLAIGLSRLGMKAGWISRLGEDEFGRYIHNFIRGEGVDTSRIRFDSEHPTGLYFKEKRSPKDIRVTYYRRGSAASCLTPEDIDEEYLSQAKCLHLTGITPALSDSCLAAVERSIEIARRHGLLISFDPNIRLKLWTIEEARKTLLRIAAAVDLVLPGVEEGRLLFGLDDPAQIAEEFFRLGAKTVIVKTGPEGALIKTEKGLEHVPGFPVETVDPVGAGDGFAAGVLTGYLQGKSWKDSVRLGNAVGAFVVGTSGDVEGLPTMEEIRQFMDSRNQQQDVRR